MKYDTWVSSLLSFLFVMPSFYTNLQILKILFFRQFAVQKCNHLTLHLLLHKLSKTLKLHFITNLLLLIEGITRMSQNYLNIDRFIYGGDYNPEQWLDRPDIFKQDLLLMKKAHINTVTLGVFSWSTLEPIKDCFNFNWLIDIIDKLYDNGIQVILAPLWIPSSLVG